LVLGTISAENINEEGPLKFFSVDIINRETWNPLLKNECVRLFLPESVLSTPICVYPKDDDKWVSGSLRAAGTWQREEMAMIKKVLSSLSTDAYLFDMGCNIGVFTLMAAKLGHHVVAVDPFRQNLFLLARSLVLGQLEANVTLLHNAIGDKMELISLQEEKGNIGGTQVKSLADMDNIDDAHTAMAVTLDHLTPLLDNKTVVIKMDVESYEWMALKGGYTFFQKVNIPCIFMEWMWHKHSAESALEIINFMTKFSFKPFSRLIQQFTLDTFRTWPDDVIWINMLTFDFNALDHLESSTRPKQPNATLPGFISERLNLDWEPENSAPK